MKRFKWKKRRQKSKKDISPFCYLYFDNLLGGVSGFLKEPKVGYTCQYHRRCLPLWESPFYLFSCGKSTHQSCIWHSFSDWISLFFSLAKSINVQLNLNRYCHSSTTKLPDFLVLPFTCWRKNWKDTSWTLLKLQLQRRVESSGRTDVD